MFWNKKINSGADGKDNLDNKLHGVDLNIWQYIGSCDIKYLSNTNKSDIIAETTVYYFIQKNDFTKRKYIIPQSSNRFINHPYIAQTSELWLANEYELYEIVKTLPSVWLKNYMLEKFQHEWDNKSKLWVAVKDAKYKKALDEQQKKNDEDINNVVSLKIVKKEEE